MTNKEYEDIIFEKDQAIAIREQYIKEACNNFNMLADINKKLYSYIENLEKQIKNKGKDDNMRFYVPKGCTLFQRSSNGRWEAKMMIDGVQKYIGCSKIKSEIYKKLMAAYKENKNKSKVVEEKELTLFEWLDRWHQIYRKPKEGMELSKNTLLSDKYTINKIKTVFKDKKLKDLTGDYIQRTLYSMKQGRTCENCYNILKLALEKSKDRTNGFNIMSLVEKPRHERIRGRALSKDEISKILDATRDETERDIINFYIYTGCRAGELVNTLVEYVNLSNESRTITNLKFKGKSIPDITLLQNEIFILGSKTKGSMRTLPIMPPLKPILERLIANRKGKEKLFGRYTTVMIRNFHDLIKDKTMINFTIKDYRHTAATSFKDAGIPSSVYFRWFGWSDETMGKRVYTHETDYEKILSQEWAAKFV